MLAALRAAGLRRAAGRQHRASSTAWAASCPPRAPKLFLGNAGTAMRPLTAALAVLGGDFELSAACRACTSARSATWSMRCASSAARSTTWATTATRRCASASPSLKLDAPIQVRGDVSSQFLTALLMALPLVATQDIVIEVVGELISKPYIEITLNLLARFGITVRREGWQRFTIPAGSRYQSPASSMSRPTPRLPAISSPSAQSPPRRAAANAASKGVGADSIQGDIRFIEAARLMGATSAAAPTGWTSRAAPGRSRPSTWTATTSPTPP